MFSLVSRSWVGPVTVVLLIIHKALKCHSVKCNSFGLLKHFGSEEPQGLRRCLVSAKEELLHLSYLVVEISL